MSRFCWRSVKLALACGMVAVAGCSSGTTTPAPAPTTVSTPSTAKEDLPKGLAKLSDADREAAVKQKDCPVTGAALGSMGAPPKVTVEGKEVFLCCAGCEEELRKDPAKYLAKIDAK